MRAENLRLRAGLAPHLGHNVAAAYQARNLVFAAQRCAPPVARVSIHLHRSHTFKMHRKHMEKSTKLCTSLSR